MKNKKLLFPLVVMAVSVAYIVTTLTYEDKAQVMPLLVAVPTLLLGILQTYIELTKKPKKKVDEGVEYAKEEEAADNSTTISVFTSIAVLGMMIYIIGFMVSIPLFLFGFLLWVAKVKAARAALFSMIFTGVVYALFVVFLKAQLYQGVLFKILS